MANSVLELRGISKRFGGVAALTDVSLTLGEGEVLAVVGENGAGKSTMMKIIGGVHPCDSGSILLDGRQVGLKSPSEALDRGIRVIYQELSVLENLDVTANIFLGRERRRGPFLDVRAMRTEAVQILSRLKLRLAPSRSVGSLPLAERQLVEIARALSLQARILILDEPTSSLTLDETNNLLEIVRELKGQGVSIIYVSHRLDEVMAVADRIVVLRDGRSVGEIPRASASIDAIVSLMIGRDLQPNRASSPLGRGADRLRLKGLRSGRYPQAPVDLEVRAGEILGMAGLVGAGRSELARAVFGIDGHGGEIEIDGKAATIHQPRDAIDAGIYLVPEDRRQCGLTITMTVRENISMPSVGRFARGGLIDRTAEKKFAQQCVDRFQVKASGIEAPALNLSGGNQQKVVLARWLSREPKVLIFDEPTRGVDVGSKAEIYADMRKLADSGVAIWMISSDMEEVLGVSDRIAVLHEGRIQGILDRGDVSEEAVMQLAVGGQP